MQDVTMAQGARASVRASSRGPAPGTGAAEEPCAVGIWLSMWRMSVVGGGACG